MGFKGCGAVSTSAHHVAQAEFEGRVYYTAVACQQTDVSAQYCFCEEYMSIVTIGYGISQAVNLSCLLPTL